MCIKEKVENLTWETGLNDKWGLHEHKEGIRNYCLETSKMYVSSLH